MVESVARLAWDAARPFMRKPLLRVSIVRPLAVITQAVNALGARDRQFQVRLYVTCFLVYGLMWIEL